MRPIPATDARWHHFVPKLTLRGFECPDRGKHVVHLDKTSGMTRKVSIESASAEEHLYSAPDDDGGHDNRIEGFLALVEGYAAPALRRLLDGQSTPSEDESMPISMFMGLQITRTPEALDAVGVLAEQMGRADLDRLLNDPIAHAAVVSANRGVSLTPAELEDDRQEALAAFRNGVQLRLAGKRNVGLEAMITGVIEASLAMADADWWVLAPEEGSFVVGDCGYARFAAEDRLPIEHGLLFPLRTDRCILVAPSTAKETTQVYYAKATATDVRTINLRSYGWATRFLYGHSQHTVCGTRAAVRDNRRRARSPRPQERLPGPP